MPASNAPVARTGRRGRAVVLFVVFDDGTGRTDRQRRRTLDMARALVGQAHVIVAVTGAPWADASGIHVVRYETAGALRVLTDNSDVAVVPARLLDAWPTPIRTSARLVVDLFEPVAVTSHALRVGDAYLCASEAQRDACRQALAANSRVKRRRPILVVPDGPFDSAQGEASPTALLDPLRLYCACAARPSGNAALVAPSLTARVLRVWRYQGTRAVARRAAAYLRQRTNGR